MVYQQKTIFPPYNNSLEIITEQLRKALRYASTEPVLSTVEGRQLLRTGPSIRCHTQ
jgi:hypothetical protein